MSIQNQVQEPSIGSVGSSGIGCVTDNEWARERAELAFDVFKVPVVPEVDDSCNLPVKVTAHRSALEKQSKKKIVTKKTEGLVCYSVCCVCSGIIVRVHAAPRSTTPCKVSNLRRRFSVCAGHVAQRVQHTVSLSTDPLSCPNTMCAVA